MKINTCEHRLQLIIRNSSLKTNYCFCESITFRKVLVLLSSDHFNSKVEKELKKILGIGKQKNILAPRAQKWLTGAQKD